MEAFEWRKCQSAKKRGTVKFYPTLHKVSIDWFQWDDESDDNKEF